MSGRPAVSVIIGSYDRWRFLKMWDRGYEVIDSPDSYVEHHSHANPSVREGNLERQKADWSSYLEKWTGVFYDPEKGNDGGWVEKEFSDPGRTANKFLKAELGNAAFLKVKLRSLAGRAVTARKEK